MSARLRVDEARRRDLPAVAELLATALETDAVFLDVIPPRADRRRVLGAFFDVYVLTYFGADRAIDLIRDPDGRVVAAATWARHGVGRESRFAEQAAIWPRYVRALGVRGLLPPFRVQRVLERHRPLDTHWFLSAVAVLPSHRDAGIGTELVLHRLERIDELQEDAYVESATPHDRRFFERLGFVPGAVIQGLATAKPVGMFRAPVRRRRRSDQR